MSTGIKTLPIAVMLVMIGVCFQGCKDWEYDIEKNGIHFEKIYQSKGGTHTGYMTEDRILQGFPCEKGWIHFRPNWELLSFQLSRDFTYQGTLLPAHTWIHFPYHDTQTGYVCSFPCDYTVQGFLCGGSGGYKGTHTGFYDSGRLRSFFAPENVIVDEVPCEASIFANVNLYENGHIKSCKLADAYHSGWNTYKKGKTIHFDRNGNIE